MGVRTAERITGFSMERLQHGRNTHYTAVQRGVLLRREMVATRGVFRPLMGSPAQIRPRRKGKVTRASEGALIGDRLGLGLSSPSLKWSWCGSAAGGGLRCRSSLISARAVHAGNRHSDQAVIHAELRAMMDQVVHHEAADNSNAWHGENFLATRQQLPACRHISVADTSQVSTR